MTTFQQNADVQPKTQSANWLRRVLLADSALCAASGVALVVAAGPLAALMGLDAPLALMITGILLLLWAGDLFYFGTRPRFERAITLTAIVLNTAWVLASWLLVAVGWPPLSSAGIWLVLIVADVVALIAIAQFVLLRRKSRQHST